MLHRIGYCLSLFLFGGYAYCLAEVLFRGDTHPSMLLLGGVCFLMIGGLYRARLPFAAKMALSAAAVTVSELLCGLIVNRALGLDVWDYSDLPWNFRGQVCVTYSAVWCLLSVPAMGLHRLFCRVWKFPEKVPGKQDRCMEKIGSFYGNSHEQQNDASFAS